MTEHPFVKSECSVKLKKSCKNNPEARTGNAFQVCLQLSLNMFLSPSFLSKGFLLFGDILQGSSIGDRLSVKEQGGRGGNILALGNILLQPALHHSLG